MEWLGVVKMEGKKILIITTALVTALIFMLIFNANKDTAYGQENILKNIGQYEEDLRQITCYCGCEHTDLYNCYEEDMLNDCGLCMKEYETYLEMRNEKSIEDISDYIDKKYGKNE